MRISCLSAHDRGGKHPNPVALPEATVRSVLLILCGTVMFLVQPTGTSFAQSAQVTLSGVVSDERSNGLEGVEVLVSSEDGVIVGSANTDQDGNYKVEIHPGTYDVVFSPSPSDNFVPLILEGEDIHEDRVINVALVDGAFQTATYSGVLLDHGGVPLPRHVLKLLHPDAYEASVTTDENGQFSVTVLRGLYRLVIDPPYGSLGRLQTDAGALNLNADLSQDLVLPSTGSLTVKVVGPDGQALPEAKVGTGSYQVTPFEVAPTVTMHGQAGFYGTTDSAGSFTMPVWPTDQTLELFVEPPPNANLFPKAVPVGPFDAGSDQTVVVRFKPTLSALVVQPENASVVVGLSQRFIASGIYSDGSTEDLTQSVNWSSSDANVASIDAIGLATGHGEGTVEISAVLEGVANLSAKLTVGPPALARVEISPNESTITPGRTMQFSATAIYTDGSTVDVTEQAVWSSADTKIATVEGGLADAKRPGETTIGVQLETESASTLLTVEPGPPGGGGPPCGTPPCGPAGGKGPPEGAGPPEDRGPPGQRGRSTAS